MSPLKVRFQIVILTWLVLLAAALACNLPLMQPATPTPFPPEVLTAGAETLAAQMTIAAPRPSLTPSPYPMPAQPSPTPIPPIVLSPSPTWVPPTASYPTPAPPSATSTPYGFYPVPTYGYNPYNPYNPYYPTQAFPNYPAYPTQYSPYYPWPPSPTPVFFPWYPTPYYPDRPTPPYVFCDAARFVKDVTYPDGTVVQPGQLIIKTWRLRNVGTCMWNMSYAIVYFSGDLMGGALAYPLPGVIAPGQEVDISINLVAPLVSGHARGEWKLRNSMGVVFGLGDTADKPFWVDVNVAPTPAIPTLVYPTPWTPAPFPTFPPPPPTLPPPSP